MYLNYWMYRLYTINLFICAVAVIFSSVQAHASCAVPVVPPLVYERANWLELEKLKVSADINKRIDFVQDLQSRGHGSLNLDFYAITIDANGQPAESLFQYVRANLDSLVFGGTAYALNAYNAANSDRWKSDDPTGALMSFTLAGIDGVMPLERGSVVVSCYSSMNFVFSTVKTAKDGLHPVAGNRAFGVHDHGNGILTIYVKAADRVVNKGLFGKLGASLREEIFAQGHKVWLRMLKNLTEIFKERNPATFVYSERVAY